MCRCSGISQLVSVGVSSRDVGETEKIFNISKYMKIYPTWDTSMYEVVDTDTIIKQVGRQGDPSLFTLEFRLLYVYRWGDWAKLYLPETVAERMVTELRTSLVGYDFHATFHASEPHWDLLSLGLESQGTHPHELRNLIHWILSNRHVQHAQFILVEVAPDGEPSQTYMTITRQAELWPFITSKMRRFCHVNAPLTFAKNLPRPTIPKHELPKVEQYYDQVGYYIAEACQNRELTVIRYNPETETGYPLRFQRNTKHTHNDEAIYRPIKIRTSEDVVEAVHELGVLSFIPNCHRIGEDYPTHIVIDMDAWWSVPYAEFERSVRERLLDYCQFLRQHGIEFYLTFSGRRGFHVYIPIERWPDGSVFLPRNTRFQNFLERREHEIRFLACHDAVEVLNIYYSILSPLGPIVPGVSLFDMQIRVDNILFDNRVSRNIGARCVGALNQHSALVCTAWDLAEVPLQFRELCEQSTMEQVIRDDLRRLDVPSVPRIKREENVRIIAELAWTHRYLIIEYFKLGYQRFFQKKRGYRT